MSRKSTSDSEAPSYFVRSGFDRHHPRGVSAGFSGLGSANDASCALSDEEERPVRSAGCRTCGASTKTFILVRKGYGGVGSLRTKVDLVAALLSNGTHL